MAKKKDHLSRKELLQIEDPVEIFIGKVVDWFKLNGVKLLIAAGVVLVIGIAVNVVLGIQEQTLAEANTRYTEARRLYDEALGGQRLDAQQGEDTALSEAQVTDRFQRALTQFETIVADYGDTTAGEHSAFMMAKTAYALAEYDRAAQLITDYKAKYPEGHYQLPVIMLEAAVQESLGNPSAAGNLYAALISDYPSDPARVAAMQQLARIREGEGNLQAARDLHQQLMDMGNEMPFYSDAKGNRDRLYVLMGEEPPPDDDEDTIGGLRVE